MDHGVKIKIQSLNLYIGKQHILKDINAVIPEKKITVILGPSGCGKTTLMKSMNRLTDIYPEVKVTGQIFINDDDILHTQMDITKLRQKMGLLSQRPYPLPMNIYNNVAYGLRISGRRKKQFLDKRVEHYLRMANLWDEVKDRLNDPAIALSGGQQQRLCLARVIALQPEVILLDEPTSGLDPISTGKVEAALLELKKEYTIILVPHSIQQAARTADYAAFFLTGELIEYGEGKSLFTIPKQKKTEDYIMGRFG